MVTGVCLSESAEPVLLTIMSPKALVGVGEFAPGQRVLVYPRYVDWRMGMWRLRAQEVVPLVWVPV
jgi:hypothetical protein